MSINDSTEFDAPEVVVVSLLRDAQQRFEDVAQSSVSIHYGWFDENETRPEITVGEPEESPIDGGDTGYSGWKADGSGPTQVMGGTVTAHLWTTSDRSDVNPRKLLWLFKQEIKSVMSENANAPTSEDLGNLGYGGFQRLPPETDKSPTRWHATVTVNYGYVD